MAHGRQLTSATGAALPRSARLPTGRLGLALAILAAVAALSLPLLDTATSGPAPASTAAPANPSDALAPSAKLPLAFVPNRGQLDDAVRYYAHAAGVGFYLTRDEIVMDFGAGDRRAALGLRFVGANPSAALDASRRLPGEVNHLAGERDEWRAGLPTYGALVYRDLWPGIDMAVRSGPGRLKYEFHVAPGARVSDIQLAYRGADGLKLNAGGGLGVTTPLGVLRDDAPVSYQRRGGERVPVESSFALTGGAGYGFAVGGGYDPSRTLVIDPSVRYSTFLGGSGREPGDASAGGTTTTFPNSIAVDGYGNAYVTGETTSPDFPTTMGAYSRTNRGGGDAFVTKLDASGTALVYSTLLGGSALDQGFGIAVDGSGRAHVVGLTASLDIPTTPGAYDRVPGGGPTPSSPGSAPTAGR